MRKWTLRVWVLVWLTLVWVLLWGTPSPANILGGLAIAIVVTVLLPMPAVPVQGRLHPLSLLRLMLWVAWHLVESSLQVAWLAVRPGRPPKAAVLQAQLSVKSDLVLSLAVQILNLIPGSIVLEIDQEHRRLTVHVLDVATPRAEEQFHQQVARVESLLVAALERDEDWREAEA